MQAVAFLILLSALAAAFLGIASSKLRSLNSTVAPAANAAPALNRPANFSELLALPRDRIESCEIALMNLLCAEGLRGAENLNVTDCLATLDQWAGVADFDTRRHLYRFQKNPAEFDHSEAKFRVLMLGMVLQNNFNVRYNPDRITPAGVFEPNDVFFADSRDVLLHGLLGPRRMGTCSSLPVLYIAVGRRLGYPLKLVKTKSHLVARWDSPSEQFNIETSGRGVGWYDDEHFKQWPLPVSDEEIKTMGLLKSLTPIQELATFLSIRGACLAAMGRTDEAIACYEHAVRLEPESLAPRLALAAARQEIARSSSAAWADFDHPEFNSATPNFPGSPFAKRPIPLSLPGGEPVSDSPNIAPLLGGAGGGFTLPMHGPNESRQAVGAPPIPRPGLHPGSRQPNPFLPTTPQLRIPNPYQQGGP
ncbi:MAG: tetratricopeptide repeat protein [Verrucomicrobia bacterium]|nr:tetratricopeptide repeat protein [Verrucomicrobiota bacterium]